jgi:acetyl-CoA carboxylase biotin carboxylase subunit
MFKRILIANRGEIAMRIIRCCRTLDVETVLVHSTADADSLPVQYANYAVCIGKPQAADSYLNQDRILETARKLNCDAIHPGFGFLSENPQFVRRCEEAGITFIGPSADVIERMGNKQAARELMIKHGVPVVPGSDGLVEDADQAEAIAKQIGYPVLIKASAGGGGRGMRKAFDPSQIRQAYETAKAEAIAAFGNGDMYMEKLIVDPHHIEFQILADREGNIVQLGERDCSIQRRNQKLIEESPSKMLDDDLRKRMGADAVKAAKAAGYYNAGTVEFVLDQNGNYYFIEMNTRIQVEHPVTEMVSGFDLIREQIRIAAGARLTVTQEDICLSGHAIECRINAEIPQKNFMPSPGKIDFLHFPAGCGVRVDSALYNGCETSPYYDSMIAKIIVHAPTRLDAIRRMRGALEELIIDGIETNADFLYLVMYHPDYLRGQFDTSFLEKNTEALLDFEQGSLKEMEEA